MLRNVLFFSFLFLISGLNAQQVVATTGYFAENQQISLSWTVGETFVTTLSSENNFLTQGFNQSKLSLTIVFEKKTEPGLKIYPNPVTNGEFFISGIKNNSEVHIYSLNGQVVQTVKNVSDKDRILLKKLPKGVYIIKTQDQATKIIVK